jgi:uncharacterized protein YkwD
LQPSFSFLSALPARLTKRRRSKRIVAVTDYRRNSATLRQARAMAAAGTADHTAASSFASRVGSLRLSNAVESVAAGYTSFADTSKQWDRSSGHRRNLLMPGAKKNRNRFGCKSAVATSNVPGDDHC